MVIKFKASSPIVLGDDLAEVTAGERWTVELEQWGLTCKVQEEELPEPANGSPFLAPLGNVRGPLVFTATRSFATFAAGMADFATKLALVNLQDRLDLWPYGTGLAKFSYANSVCESVIRVPGQQASNGVRWKLRFSFRIGAQTVTIP